MTTESAVKARRWDPGEFTKPLKPATAFSDSDPYCVYWMQSEQIFWRWELVRGADPESFVFYLGNFAKDKGHCYCGDRRLTGANAQEFRALNNTYFKDDSSVWCFGGRIKEADARSFVACDDGIYSLDDLAVPHGYGKDGQRVFYYDSNGKACWVRKADPATFESLNDGWFGRDGHSVFCGHASIAGADVRSWRKLGGYYSKDDRRVYYFNRVMKNAHHESFRVVPAKDGTTQLARDQKHFYWTDRVVEKDFWLKDAVPDAL